MDREEVLHWNCIQSNPFRLAEKPKVPELLPKYFEKDDFKKLIGSVDDIDFRELCLCAVMTGLRLSELTALQWTNIDFGHGVIRVQSSEGFTTKNMKVRVVP